MSDAKCLQCKSNAISNAATLKCAFTDQALQALPWPRQRQIDQINCRSREMTLFFVGIDAVGRANVYERKPA
jgi:hypothetical protein